MLLYKTMLSDILVFQENRPRRTLFLFIVQNYQVIVGFCITLILLLSVLRHASLWIASWIFIYLLYRLILVRFFLLSTKLGYRLHTVHIARSLILLIGVTVFIGYIYLFTDFLNKNNTTDTLWLLYAMALFIVCQYGTTTFLLAIIFGFCPTSLLFLQYAKYGELNFVILSDWAVKILWLSLLAFIVHVLTRYISNIFADLRLISDVQHKILEAGADIQEDKLLDIVVRKIADNFCYPHVNIFEKQPDLSLKCVASSSAVKLVENEFVLEAGKGIIGSVVQKGESHVTNNVENDSYYVSHSTFSDTKAELAVPIRIGNEIKGVLDIQDKRKNIFIDQDKELMEILADYVGKAWNNIQLMREKEQIDKTIHSVATRFLSEYKPSSTSFEIAQAAYEELKADVVVLYERNVASGELNVNAYVGTLRFPKYFKSTVDNTYHLVNRILSSSDDYYFHESVAFEGPQNRVFELSDKQIARGYPPFAEREGVVSRAILRLKVAGIDMGVIFLNYRKPHSFQENERRRLRAFSYFAALAIRKAQIQQQRIESERQELASLLHDKPKNQACIIADLVSKVLTDSQLEDKHQKLLRIAYEAVEDLKDNLRYLETTWKNLPTNDLRREIEKAVDIVRTAYDINLDVKYEGYSPMLPSTVVTEFLLILNEAFLNVYEHANATRVQLRVTSTEEKIDIVIEDDGRGFDIREGSGSGIMNMEMRAKRIRGKLKIETAPGSGTRIMITIPGLYEVE